MPIRKELVGLKSLRRAKRGSEWSGWQQPVMFPRRYTLYCCDCSLAHQFQYRIRPDAKTKEPVVQWRVRRSNGYTQAARKHAADHNSKAITRLNQGERIKACVDNVYVADLPNGLRRNYGKRTQKVSKHAPPPSPIRPARKNSRQRKRGR